MNPFEQFNPATSKVYIKALKAEVTLRDLTLKDLQQISASLVDGTDAKGNPKVNLKAALRTKYVKISAALVEPKMTAEQLEGLSTSASEAIKELLYLVDPEAAQAEEESIAEATGGKAPNASEA